MVNSDQIAQAQCILAYAAENEDGLLSQIRMGRRPEDVQISDVLTAIETLATYYFEKEFIENPLLNISTC